MRDHFPDWHEGSGSAVRGVAGAGAGAGCSEDEGVGLHGLGLGSGHGVSAQSEGNRARSGRDRVENGNAVEMVSGGHADVSCRVTAMADLGVDHVHGGFQADLAGSSGDINRLQPPPYFFTGLEVQPTTTLLDVYHPLQRTRYYHPLQQEQKQQKQEQQGHIEPHLHSQQQSQPSHTAYQLQQEQPPIRPEQPQPRYMPAAPFYNVSAGLQPTSHDHPNNSSIFLPPNKSLPQLYHQSTPQLQPSDDSSVGMFRNMYHGLSQLSTTDSSPTASYQPLESSSLSGRPQPLIEAKSAISTASSSNEAISLSPVVTSPDATPSSKQAVRRTEGPAARIVRRKTQLRIPSPSSHPMTPAATPTGQGDGHPTNPIPSTNAALSETSQRDSSSQSMPGKRDRENDDSEDERNGQDEVPQEPEEPRPKKRKGRGRPRLTETIDKASAAERRRTQIRIAQRAYRDRKDQVIIRLEDEVEKLKKTKDDYFQGVVDIVKLFRSNDMMNSQAGLEFSHRFQDIIDRICRINAGERGELASVD